MADSKAKLETKEAEGKLMTVYKLTKTGGGCFVNHSTTGLPVVTFEEGKTYHIEAQNPVNRLDRTKLVHSEYGFHSGVSQLRVAVALALQSDAIVLWEAQILVPDIPDTSKVLACPNGIMVSRTIRMARKVPPAEYGTTMDGWTFQSIGAGVPGDYYYLYKGTVRGMIMHRHYLTVAPFICYVFKNYSVPSAGQIVGSFLDIDSAQKWVVDEAIKRFGGTHWY